MTVNVWPRAVLFDLDGTLIDSAPDLLGAVTAMRRRCGLVPQTHGAGRHHIGLGALGIMQAGFADRPDIDLAPMRDDFLAHYEANIWQSSQVFEGLVQLLRSLRSAGVRTGIVTNKIARLAELVLDRAQLADQVDCLIAGDTVARAKPHPEPVLEACRRLQVAPEDAIMVGDDARDIQAGKAAGTWTIAAAWGYIDPAINAADWQADLTVEHPGELAGALQTLARTMSDSPWKRRRETTEMDNPLDSSGSA